MPASSPEAIARKQAKQNAKCKNVRAAKIRATRIQIQKSDWPQYKIAARNMLPRLPEMSKSELREMLAQAMQNTAVSETTDV